MPDPKCYPSMSTIDRAWLWITPVLRVYLPHLLFLVSTEFMETCWSKPCGPSKPLKVVYLSSPSTDIPSFDFTIHNSSILLSHTSVYSSLFNHLPITKKPSPVFATYLPHFVLSLHSCSFHPPPQPNNQSEEFWPEISCFLIIKVAPAHQPACSSLCLHFFSCMF